MNKSDFNPNDIGVPNGNYFGFPYSPDESKVLILPVPWDVTTSYGAGTSNGPKAILDASVQLDFYDFDVENAWKIGHGTLPFPKEIFALNSELRPTAEKIIDHLEQGNSPETPKIKELLNKINQASEKLNAYVFEQSNKYLTQNKLIALVGGDHSTPLGLINAVCEKYDEIGILHIDAHADLRNAYEGFEFSHASIMFNALKNKSVSRLVQVGIRDVCDEEVSLTKTDSRIVLFDDNQLKENQFNGISWKEQCDQIISNLPENVYLSFDIDGLNPSYCPNTGTPVPGGLDFDQALYLIKQLVNHNKKIVSFDLNEVSPGNDEWDANVGARLLYKISNLMYKSHQ
ncbi:MAG: agmatinase family protein [Rhodothermaceae bacterium]